MNLEDKFNLRLECSIDCSTNSLAFQHAVKIFLNKPQVVNKWVAGSINTSVALSAIKSKLDLEAHLNANLNLNYELKEFISKSNKIFSNLKYIIVSDAEYENVLFHPIIEDHQIKKYSSICFTHLIRYDKAESKLKLFIDADVLSEPNKKTYELQVKWLSDNLLPKLKNWCLNIKTDPEFTCTKLNTLTLYDDMVNDYTSLYQKLKEIYWHRFNSSWFDETNTSPEKFIHEDISIAAYLMLVWKHFEIRINNFVDLGCGNGLLVYILNDQGFRGYGVDMRKRKVWSNEFYVKASVRLVERTIDPRASSFEDADWLIGNHSDELSPWLPIIALKSAKISNKNCNFLLIPCCFFDFTAKFDVKKPNESRYDTYLNYISEICKTSGFELFKDKLRIPSTRNVCFICLMGKLDESSGVDLKLKEKILNLVNNSGELDSVCDFKARDLELEKNKSSRNCTKNVEFEIKTFIIKKVFESLLDPSKECAYLEKEDGTKWNAGCSMSLTEVADLFEKETLNKLKLECGGISNLIWIKKFFFSIYFNFVLYKKHF
jgi:tRNASer (uridine44-2'-O)-methyltransferase